MKIVRTWLLLALSALILTFGIGAAYAAPSVSIDPASSPVANAGDSFDVDVLVDPAGEELAGGTVELSFDASVLSITAHSPGTIFSSSSDMGSDWDTPGYAKINLAGMGCNATTQGTWAAITFEVADGTLNGTYDIEITSATLKYGDTSVIPGTTTTNGTVTVGTPGLTLTWQVEPPTSITQGDDVPFDVEFSESADYYFRIENSTGDAVWRYPESGTGTAKNPSPRTWTTTTGTPQGDYTLIINTNGVDNSDTRTVTVGSVTSMTVEADPTSVINSTATDVIFNVTSDGSPVDGALVTLSGCGVDTNGTTGTDGTVTISVTATSTGTIDVTVTKDGYDDATTTVDVNPAPSTAPLVCIDPTSSPVANAGDSFDVDVLVDPAGEELAGGTVELSFDASVLSIAAHSPGTIFSSSSDMGSDWDTPGYAKINLAGMGCTATTPGTWAAITFEVADGTLNGTYDIEITSATLKYGDTTVIPGTTVTNGTVTVGTPGLTMNVEAVPTSVLKDTATAVTFNVTSEGTPVDGALVTLLGCGVDTSGTTGADGIATISVTATDVGAIAVTATKDGYADATTTVAVTGGVTTNPMDVTAVPTSVLKDTATEVKFNVTSEGTPVDGALVTLLGCGVDTSGTTGADGIATISVTATDVGAIAVTATKDGYDEATTTVDVTAHPMAVTRDPTSVLRGTATDVTFNVTSDGVPVDNATVTLLGCGVNTNGTTDVNGTVTISVTATDTGAIAVTATKDTYEDATTTVAVTAPSNGGSGRNGGNGGTYPPGWGEEAPAPAATPAPTAAPEPTVAPTKAPTVAPTEAPTKAPTVAPTETTTTEMKTEGTPGFGAVLTVFAIAGLLVAAYLVMRRRE